MNDSTEQELADALKHLNYYMGRTAQAEAEVERLREENAANLKSLEVMDAFNAAMDAKRKKAEAEVVGLRYKLDHECAALLECQCERERLRAALEQALCFARAALRGGE